MTEILALLKETISKSAAEEFRRCVQNMPDGASWYVVSDYCFDDPNKAADVATFSVIPKHDKIKSICEYLKAFAPRDIKASQSTSMGFLQYVNLPIVFHFSFVLRKTDAYLRGIMPHWRIREYLDGLKEFTASVRDKSPTSPEYFNQVIRRINIFANDMDRKSFSQRLARKVILTSLLCGTVCFYLSLFNQAELIALIPDRDAISEAYDGIYFDSAFMCFVREISATVISPNSEIPPFDKPRFQFIAIGQTEESDLDALIRIPDYLAGTLAEYGMARPQASRPKYEDVLFDSLSNSVNHAIISLEFEDNTLICRRAKFEI
jgi:hypothetical protein